jgi:hypothetical protein
MRWFWKRPTVKVSVTVEDIQKGRPEDALACPVARAFRRALPDARQVVVAPNIFGFLWTVDYCRHVSTTSKEFEDVHYLTSKSYTVRLPLQVGRWIKKFDQRGADSKELPPFDFELRLPKEE